MILRILAQATVILIHEKQNISSSIILFILESNPMTQVVMGGFNEKKQHTVVI